MRLLLFIITLFVSITTLAQTSAQGLLLDANTQQPVAGATIKAGNEKTISDSIGRFTLPVGNNKTLVITAIGYERTTIGITAGTELPEIFLQPQAAELSEVVVSGTLRPMTRLQSPIPVESYNAAFFKRNPTPNFFDAVAQLNGVQSQMTCNVCNTGEIRINGLDGPYTMVLIDGMPIVSSLSTVYGLSGIPASMIKRIEVVKGPASTLYGSEAVGGLINIITVDPLSAHKLSVDANLTSQQELNVDLGLRLNLGKTTGLLGVNYYDFSNRLDINKDNFTDITLQKRFSLFNKYSFDRKSNLPASVAFRFLSENRWGGEMNYQDAYKGGDSIYGESIDTRRVEMIGQYGITKNILAEYSYNYHWQDSYYGTTYYKGEQHTGFAQVRWNKKIGKHYLLAGIPFRYQFYDDNTPATTKENGANQPSVQKMAGVFVQDEYQFNDAFTLLGGIRYEYTNIQGGVVAPRLALKYQPDALQTFRLSAGNGFRIVNLFTEDHAALSGFREVEIREALRPERSWNLNLNYARNIPTDWGLLDLDVSGFYTYFTNRIVPDYDSDPQKIIYDNLDGHAISKGITANINLANNQRFRAGIGVTYMDVYVKEPDENGVKMKTQQVYAPRWSGTYNVSYALRGGTSFDLTGQFMGPMRLPVFSNDFRNEYSPFYSLLNLQITQKVKDHLEFYIVGKNLLNFIPKNPILHPDDPFDRPGGPYWLNDGSPNPGTNPNGFSFDPTYNYAPMQGIRLMIGCRFSLH